MTKKEMIFWQCVAPTYIRIRKVMIPQGLTQLLYSLAIGIVLYKGKGKGWDSLCTAFMLLHQEEKKSDDCQPTVQQSERKPKRKSVVWKGAGENESEGMLCHTLNPTLANMAPLPDQVAVQIAPMPRTYSLLSHLHLFPTYGEWLEVSMLIPGAQALSFISPSKAPQGTQFEQGATFKTGQCLLSGYSIGGFKAKGQLDVYGCTIHSQLQI